jgi:hypothetical protein
VLFCQNARLTQHTTAGWAHVRAIRVLAGKGLTVRSSHSYIVHAGSEVTELGTVPLAPDGSFAVEVPADTAIAFQAVDAEGRSELNEMSWIYVRPGETRGCVGCHQPRQVAPPHHLAMLQAMQPNRSDSWARENRIGSGATTPPSPADGTSIRPLPRSGRAQSPWPAPRIWPPAPARSRRSSPNSKALTRPAPLGRPTVGDLPRPRGGARPGNEPR